VTTVPIRARLVLWMLRNWGGVAGWPRIYYVGRLTDACLTRGGHYVHADDIDRGGDFECEACKQRVWP